jgi:ATP-binding cassette subfamily B protein
MPGLVKNATNDFLGALKVTASLSSTLLLCLSLGGFYILLAILKGFFLFLTRQMIIVVSRNIEYDLKNEIYSQYQKLSLSFFKANKTGDLMNRISEDVSQVRMYLGPGLMYTINLLILSVMIIYAMFQVNVSLTLIVLAPLPILSYLIYKVSSKMNLHSKMIQEEQSLLSTIVQESFSGIRVVKAYIRELELQNKFNATSEEFKNKNMNFVFVNALFLPTVVFLIGVSTLLTIYYGGILTFSNDITPGDIIAFIFYVNMLTWPFASVGWVTSINQRAAASQTRINEFLDIKPEIINVSNEKLEEIKEIKFENVSFTYSNSGIQAIKNLSFDLKKGETLGIVGKTGSGKSTILNLLTRQVEPSSGIIKINELGLKETNLNDFRLLSGVVPQDVFLFSDTIGNNIKFGVTHENVSEEELIEVTKTAHVYHNIIDFPDGFETILGERGVNLSGGQKQRVSIARAMIRKPQLLILDDCLSAVDTETEDVILRGIRSNFQDNITVIVSHRISSLRFADKIIVLANGEKIEEGNHEDLMKLNGIYTEMYENQLTEEEKE